MGDADGGNIPTLAIRTSLSYSLQRTIIDFTERAPSRIERLSPPTAHDHWRRFASPSQADALALVLGLHNLLVWSHTQ